MAQIEKLNVFVTVGGADDGITINNLKGYVIGGGGTNVSVLKGYIVTKPLVDPFLPAVSAEASEERFPDCISFGSSGGPAFKTSLTRITSGYADGTIEWDQVKAEYNAAFGIKSANDVRELETFFYCMRGKARVFRFKDHLDYQASNQTIAVCDGISRSFRLSKTYTYDNFSYVRPLYKIVSGTPSNVRFDGVVKVENTDYTLDITTGELVTATTLSPGTVITIDYFEFDVPVRFDIDYLPVAAVNWDQQDISSIPLIEVRLDR